MIDLSIIIFGVALVSIIVMLTLQLRKMRTSKNSVDSENNNYENYHKVRGKLYMFFVGLTHIFVIFITKIWARFSHKAGVKAKKVTRKVEDYFNHKNEESIEKNKKTQSIFLTTMKTYKHEIKKLNEKIEDDTPSARKENNLDSEEKLNTIEKS